MAHICTELAYKECWGILCSCFEALARSGHQGALSSLMQFLAKTQRPDVIAKVAPTTTQRL